MTSNPARRLLSRILDALTGPAIDPVDALYAQPVIAVKVPR